MQNENKLILIRGFPPLQVSDLNDNCSWESREFAETTRPLTALFVYTRMATAVSLIHNAATKLNRFWLLLKIFNWETNHEADMETSRACAIPRMSNLNFY